MDSGHSTDRFDFSTTCRLIKKYHLPRLSNKLITAHDLQSTVKWYFPWWNTRGEAFTRCLCFNSNRMFGPAQESRPSRNKASWPNQCRPPERSLLCSCRKAGLAQPRTQATETLEYTDIYKNKRYEENKCEHTHMSTHTHTCICRRAHARTWVGNCKPAHTAQHWYTSINGKIKYTHTQTHAQARKRKHAHKH